VIPRRRTEEEPPQRRAERKVVAPSHLAPPGSSSALAARPGWVARAAAVRRAARRTAAEEEPLRRAARREAWRAYPCTRSLERGWGRRSAAQRWRRIRWSTSSSGSIRRASSTAMTSAPHRAVAAGDLVVAAAQLLPRVGGAVPASRRHRHTPWCPSTPRTKGAASWSLPPPPKYGDSMGRCGWSAR